jgi:hypothetical protein
MGGLGGEKMARMVVVAELILTTVIAGTGQSVADGAIAVGIAPGVFLRVTRRVLGPINQMKTLPRR